MNIKKIAPKILILCCFSLFATGCSNKALDNSLKTEPYTVSDSKVAKKVEVPNSKLTGVYQGIDDMYKDSDYVVSAVVKDIEYFQEKNVLYRKINVQVNKNYKGKIEKNTLVSVLENDGYLRLKSLYEAAKQDYEKQYGNTDKEKEEKYLSSATYMSDIKDIENDKLIKLYYINKEDSKIGDELLLFLTDSSEDTYKDKTVKLFGGKLSYPKGAYASLGNGMGKFTKTGDNYKRYNLYYTPEGTNNGMQTVKDSYSIKEMESTLKKLK